MSAQLRLVSDAMQPDMAAADLRALVGRQGSRALDVSDDPILRNAHRLREVIRLAGRMLNEIEAAEEPPRPAPVGPQAGALTRRETEIMSWVARGKSNSVIADILGISAHTVDTHLRRAFGKLDTSNRTVAAVKAVRAGLVEAPFGN